MPLAIFAADPLVSVEGLPREMSVRSTKVFAEAVESAQPPAGLWSPPARDEHPGFLLRVEPVSGKHRVCFIHGLCRYNEALPLPSLPRVFEMAVPARPFVSKVTAVNSLAFRD